MEGVALTYRFRMEDLLNATPVATIRAVQEAGVESLMDTANVLDALTTGANNKNRC